MRQYFLVGTKNGRYRIVSKPIGKHPKIGYDTGLNSCTRGYITKAELLKDRGVLQKRCVHCNNLVQATGYNHDGHVTRMVENNHCFHCDFWLRKPIELPNSFRIDGYHYNNWTDYDSDGKIINGEIHMKVTMIETGEVIEVDRLTHQGEIPKRWRSMLPDNATKETIFKKYEFGK